MFRRMQIKKLSALPKKVLISSRSTQKLISFKIETSSEYMPIIDMSKEGQIRHQRQLWYDSIKALPTVEQKLYELAVHSKPQQKRFLIHGIAPTYNSTLFQRYITRTHLINQLPEKLNLMNVDNEFNEIVDVCKEAVVAHHSHDWRCSDQNYRDVLSSKNDSSKLVNILISKCFQKLALKNDYILESSIQQSPRLESFWFHSGFNPEKEKVHQQTLAFQFRDKPSYTISIRKPLNPILSLDDPLCATAEVPEYHFHPSVVGIPHDRKYLTSVAGHWFDDPCCYPFLLVNTTDFLKNLLSKVQFYNLERIKDSTGFSLGFGWLNAAAAQLGFTPFHDLTYPLVGQTILTDGQDWSFYVYQLNTIAFHDDVDKKDRRNLCWSSGTIRLYDTIEDGQIKGFNDEVFKLLLKFLMNAPIPQENVILKPYLGVDNRTEEEFNSMRYFFRQMYSQAPDPKAHKYETPAWHRIFLYGKVGRPMPFVKLE